MFLASFVYALLTVHELFWSSLKSAIQIFPITYNHLAELQPLAAIIIFSLEVTSSGCKGLDMPPKPGNAFAQQKELQRLEELETKHRDEDMPGTPATTMSMFIGPDVPHVQKGVLPDLKFPTSFDLSQKPAAGRRRLGQRAFTDPLDPTTTHSAAATDSSSFGKSSSGLGYIKSKITGKSKKYKDSESSSQSIINPAPSQYLSNMPNLRNEAMKGPSQPLPSHLSLATTQTAATPPSRYASLLKNDAMILGDISMTPTRSGSYAMAAHPGVVGVSHPSITSMAGSILEASLPDPGAMVNAEMFLPSSAQPDSYNASYARPLPPPPGDEFQQQQPFQQQLPFYLQLQPYERSDQTDFQSQPLSTCHYDSYIGGTWEQLHAQHPGTMPQFSSMNPSKPQPIYQDNGEGQTKLAQISDNSKEASELQQVSITNSVNNTDTLDTRSESGKEALEALEEPGEARASIATLFRSSLRRTASDCELRYSSYQDESQNKTSVASKPCKPAVQCTKFSCMLSPTATIFRPLEQASSTTATSTILRPDRYEGERPKQPKPAANILHNVGENFLSLQGTHSLFGKGEPRRTSDPEQKEGSSAEILGGETTRGGYPLAPQRPGYQIWSNHEEHMAHHFNAVHHHMEADKHTLRRCIEDAKTHLADSSSSLIDKSFMNQFRQLCVQSNGFRQYLQRIQQQTCDLRPGIATDVLPRISVEMASRFAAHEQRMREEFQRMNQKILTLNDSVYAMQRNLSNHVAQTNRKMDLLLEAQGIDTSSQGQRTHQDQDVMHQTSGEKAGRQQDEVIDPATRTKKEAAPTAAGTAFGASSPPNQISTPTKSRKPIPHLTKVPIMAAALTSTPPHVPQPPSSQSGSSSVATVTITDPRIPSPSVVSNARRVRHGDTRLRGDTAKENRRAGNVAKGLIDAAPIQGPGSHVHPALRYQEGIEGLAGAKEKQQTAEKKQEDDGEDKKVLWRRPSGDGEIGGRWYKAAMAQ